MDKLYLGLLSGTSMDGVDAAIVDFSRGCRLAGYHHHDFPPELLQALRELNQSSDHEIDKLGQIDVQLGKLFAEAANTLLSKYNLVAEDIAAIGSHGQNIRHRPNYPTPFTLQIGDPNTIAALTGITTVADFRRKDLALGGDGAPLTPAFHAAFIGTNTRAVLNIGGIANISLINDKVLGFDTGPGNCLMDAWSREKQDKSYDAGGAWASTGSVIPNLLAALLDDPYFARRAPKSTGTEYFNLQWLKPHLKKNYLEADVQATLLELTAKTITQALVTSGFSQRPVYVCGGGVHNSLLMQRLQMLHTGSVLSTAELAIDPDWVEAMAFAWFAKNTLEKRSSNLPCVTGAKRMAILGGIYYP